MLNNLISLYENKSLYGSWLFVGAKGLGKFETAHNLASYIIEKEYGKKALESLAVHPALKIIEKDITDKEKKDLDKLFNSGNNNSINQDKLKELKRQRSINIEQIRELIDDFSLTPPKEDKSRIVIINSINDMNPNSANSLLKFLEEPPKNTVIILICHNLNLILPTIKSRCRRINFKPLNNKEMSAYLRQKEPYLSSEDLNTVLFYANGSIGTAMEFINNDGLNIYGSFRYVIENFPAISYALAEKTASDIVKDSENAEIKVEILKNFILLTLAQRAKKDYSEADINYYNSALKMFRNTGLPFSLDLRQTIISVLTGNI